MIHLGGDGYITLVAKVDLLTHLEWPALFLAALRVTPEAVAVRQSQWFHRRREEERTPVTAEVKAEPEG